MYTEKTFNTPSLVGISEKNIEEHKKLYSGYVKNANLVLEKISLYKGDETKVYELAELYRQFSFEFNGMRNHEAYFELLSGAKDLSSESILSIAINKKFGNLENFKTALAELALTRGIGWAMLSVDLETRDLIMHWIDEQHLGQLQNTSPVIALDMWEHSYVADYQPSGKKQYILDFIENINWEVAEKRFENYK